MKKCPGQERKTHIGVSIIKPEKSQVYNSCVEALEALLGPKKFAMSDVYNLSILDFEKVSEETIEEMTEVYNSMKRPQPLMFKGCPDSLRKILLCNPKCITKMKLRCNGIETTYGLTYVLPEPCPNCDISSEDPVIVSRATSMQTIVKYKRSSCTHCEWEDEETKIAKKLLMQKYKEFCILNSDFLTTPPASPVSNQSGKESPLTFNQLLESNELETLSTSYDGQPAAKKPMLFDKFNKDLTCTICCEVFIHPVGLKCGHLFCNFCLIQCMKRKKNCPSCREPIPEKPNKQFQLENHINNMISEWEHCLIENRAALIKQREEEEKNFNQNANQPEIDDGPMPDQPRNQNLLEGTISFNEDEMEVVSVSLPGFEYPIVQPIEREVFNGVLEAYYEYVPESP